MSERTTFSGEVLKPLDPDSLAEAVDRVAASGVKSVAIALLHSYANADHEARVAEAVRARLPDVSLSVSSVLLPEMREYERTSTTVINAYVRPVVARYLGDPEGWDARQRHRGASDGDAVQRGPVAR